MIAMDGVVTALVDVGGASCTKPTTPPAFTFGSSVDALNPTSDGKASMRVSVGVPIDQANFEIEIASKGGEIVQAKKVSGGKTEDISVSLTGGGLLIASRVRQRAPGGSVEIELGLRNMIKGQNLVLTATAKLADGSKPAPIALTVEVGAVAPGAVSTGAAAPFTFKTALSEIVPSGKNTGTLRVLLSFQPGKASSIEITATRGEITGARFTNAQPAGVTLVVSDGKIVVKAAISPPKTPKPFGVDVDVQNLVAGQVLTLTATASPDVGKVAPIGIAVVPPVHESTVVKANSP
jgi:hypothetical protein